MRRKFPKRCQSGYGALWILNSKLKNMVGTVRKMAFTSATAVARRIACVFAQAFRPRNDLGENAGVRVVITLTRTLSCILNPDRKKRPLWLAPAILSPGACVYDLKAGDWYLVYDSFVNTNREGY